jgi:Fe-S-cluster containining protein
MKTIKQELPELYSKILPDFFDNNLPAEELATCDNCAMAYRDESNLTLPNEKYYAPHLKCCTYYPTMPNYLVGGILQTTNPQFKYGQSIITELINKGSNISPIGIHQPKKFKLLYEAASERGFGKSESLLCPYYNKNTNNCSIWKYRNSVCTTFFCKFIHGNDGGTFYKKFKKYLERLELVISNYVLMQKGFTSDEISAINNAIINKELNHFDLDDKKNPIQYEKHWKNYSSKEIDFYIDCYKIAADLNENDLKNIGGIELELAQGEVVQAYNQMINPKVPEKLLLNPELPILKTEGDSYKINNSFEISVDLYQAIRFFDGFSTVKVTLENIINNLSLELDEGLIISLYQNRILIDSKEFIRN